MFYTYISGIYTEYAL